MQLLADPSNNEVIELEVFFDGQQAEQGRMFSARKQLKLSIDAKQWRQQDGLEIALPENIRFANNTLLRLDFNHCSKCLVALNGAPLMSKNSLDNYAKANIIRSRNGLQSLEDQALNIIPSNWQGHHLDANGKVDGNDPFVVSPPLDIDTNKLAGVYLEISGSGTENTAVTRATFQLFYATEAHDFIEAASIYAKVNSNNCPDKHLKSNLSSQKPLPTYCVFLALDFLSEQAPAREVLERMRLDFSNKTSLWKIQKVALIPTSEKSEYLAYTPDLLAQSKLQKASKRQLVRNIINRLSRDPWFLVVYTLLLLAVAGFAGRTLKTLNR